MLCNSDSAEGWSTQPTAICSCLKWGWGLLKWSRGTDDPNLVLCHFVENLILAYLCGWVASFVQRDDKRCYNVWGFFFGSLFSNRLQIKHFTFCMALTQSTACAFLTSRHLSCADKCPENLFQVTVWLKSILSTSTFSIQYIFIFFCSPPTSILFSFLLPK